MIRTLGVACGLVIAVWCLWLAVAADRQGIATMGPGELMFVLSLPVSLLTWVGWLLPATELFSPDGNAIPRWVAYTWIAVTPPLNWGLIGWLVGRWWAAGGCGEPAPSPASGGTP